MADSLIREFEKLKAESPIYQQGKSLPTSTMAKSYAESVGGKLPGFAPGGRPIHTAANYDPMTDIIGHFSDTSPTGYNRKAAERRYPQSLATLGRQFKEAGVPPTALFSWLQQASEHPPTQRELLGAQMQQARATQEFELLKMQAQQQYGLVLQNLQNQGTVAAANARAMAHSGMSEKDVLNFMQRQKAERDKTYQTWTKSDQGKTYFTLQNLAQVGNTFTHYIQNLQQNPPKTFQDLNKADKDLEDFKTQLDEINNYASGVTQGGAHGSTPRSKTADPRIARQVAVMQGQIKKQIDLLGALKSQGHHLLNPLSWQMFHKGPFPQAIDQFKAQVQGMTPQQIEQLNQAIGSTMENQSPEDPQQQLDQYRQSIYDQGQGTEDFISMPEGGSNP